MAFISSLLKPAKHEKTKTKKGEGGEPQEVLSKTESEKREKDKIREHEEDSSDESESYSEDDSSDEENEQLNESNKTWNSENNEEDDEEHDDTGKEKTAPEIHKIYTSEEDNVSRRNSAHSNNAEYTKKKTKLSFNKKKVQSYFHKSYDKVSNAIIKTSKSFFKPHHHSDLKITKENSVSSSHALQCLENVEADPAGGASDYSDEDCGNIIKYLNKHVNSEEKNEEIIKKFNTLLESNDHKKVLEELQIILDERTLLLKSLNYFKILSINYKKQLNKSNNSYDILKSENEQLSENVKMLKKFIVSIDMNSNPTISLDTQPIKTSSCEFLNEQKTEEKEKCKNGECINVECINTECIKVEVNESDHNEDNGGITERNKGEYGSEALEPTTKDEEETMKLNLIEEHDLNAEDNTYPEIDSDNKKDNKDTLKELKIEKQDTLINSDIIIRKEIIEETTT